MLKKIPVAQLRLGMHLHKLDGAWMAHPFWKTRFVIDRTEDLRRLHACAVAECWIDTRLGVDVATAHDEAPTRAPAALPSASAAAASTAGSVFAGAGRPTSTAWTAERPPSPSIVVSRATAAEERQRAAAICDRGREAVLAMFNEARMGRTVDADRCLPLVEEISRSVNRHPDALISLARLKTRDNYSYMHSVAVCALMVALARRLSWDDEACREAGLAGLMHDVGKALMPLDLLTKPGKLSETEFQVMRSHPERGHALLLEGRGATPQMLDLVLHHHERVDGTGYPHRLGGEALSQMARMGAICDVYDAITSNRPYKAGWDPAESIARMAGWKGHFDAELFGVFVQSLGIYPTGSLVRLESGRLAVVIEQNAEQLVAPVVRAFHSLRTGMPITPLRIDLARPGQTDRIVGREAAAAADFPQRDELWAGGEALARLRR